MCKWCVVVVQLCEVWEGEGIEKGSMEVFVNIPSCIVGMRLGSLLLAGAGIGVV